MPNSRADRRHITTAVQRMAHKRMSSVVNCHFRLPLRSQTLAAHYEPLSEIAAVQRITECVLVLRADEASIIVGSLFTTEMFPRAEVVKSGLVPMKWRFARSMPFGNLLTYTNLRPSAVHLHVGKDQACNFRRSKAGTAREPENDPVHTGIERPSPLPSEVLQHASDLIWLQDFRSINAPSRHDYDPFLWKHEFGCISQFWSETNEKSNEIDCKRHGMQSNLRGRNRRIDREVPIWSEESHIGAVFHERQDDFPLFVLQLIESVRKAILAYVIAPEEKHDGEKEGTESI